MGTELPGSTTNHNQISQVPKLEPQTYNNSSTDPNNYFTRHGAQNSNFSNQNSQSIPQNNHIVREQIPNNNNNNNNNNYVHPQQVPINTNIQQQQPINNHQTLL